MECLLDTCFLSVLTENILNECETFTSGDEDMDEFFYKDALDYARFRMGKSYCFRLNANPRIIVACFTVSNDSIRIFDLGSSKKNKMCLIQVLGRRGFSVKSMLAGVSQCTDKELTGMAGLIAVVPIYKICIMAEGEQITPMWINTLLIEHFSDIQFI